MNQIFIFAGTTEGRELSEILAWHGLKSVVSVATDYGESLMEKNPRIQILKGRMDREAMLKKLREIQPLCVVDATHPFAVRASEEIFAAAEDAGLPYIRLSRETANRLGDRPTGDTCFDDLETACGYLDQTEGNILLMTGSKEIAKIAGAIKNKDRLFARVLPSGESIALCETAGLKGKQIIAMQGPFSAELNVAMLRHTGAKYLLTKETGAAGGFEDKLEAAEECSVTPVIIRNPETIADGNAYKGERLGSSSYQSENKGKRYTFEEVLTELSKLTGIDLSGTCNRGQKISSVTESKESRVGSERSSTRSEENNICFGESRVITLVGLGPGNPDYMVPAAKKALDKADVIFGAPRVLKSIGAEYGDKPQREDYLSDKILDFLNNNKCYENPVVIFSGDTGFFSGAAAMVKRIAEDAEKGGKKWKTNVVCGISSVIYFCSRINENWQDWKLLSCHGRSCNVVGNLRKNNKCFLLVSDVEEVNRLGGNLRKAEENGVLGKLKISYGYQLTYPEEETGQTDAEGLQKLEKKGLYVLLIQNDQAENCQIVPGLSDSAFLRGKAPMTKEEIRSLSLCKLRLTKGAVLYDIGAGTGSVSIEAAQLIENGRVVAIEQKEDAIKLLQENKERFCLENMEIICAKAPEGLNDKSLPVPTHAFIGGSSGNMGEILETLIGKNPRIRIVINCIALETLSEVLEILRNMKIEDPEYIQVNVSKADGIGRYHMMKASNPIFIVSFGGTV